MSAIRSPLLLAALLLSGCASVPHSNPQDPLEPLNRRIYQFNDALDRAVVKPVAKGYNVVVPAPAKMMVTNFFSNLGDIIVVANDLLQFKFKQALADSGRFAVNTTVGLFGLVDVATPVGLEKHNEDFGQTLGRWGVGSGPYLMLPLLGPSTLRDSVGDYADSYLGVWQVDDVSARNQVVALDLTNRRARLLGDEALLNEAVLDDRYSFIRDAYLQRRLNRIYDGRPPRARYDDYEDEDDDTDVDAPAPSSTPPADGAASPDTTPPAATPAAQAQPEDGRVPLYRMWVVPRR